MNRRSFLKWAGAGVVTAGGVASIPYGLDFFGEPRSQHEMMISNAGLAPTEGIIHPNTSGLTDQNGNYIQSQPTTGSSKNNVTTPNAQKTVYLTLDDGWRQKKRILGIAEYYHVPLSLFIIGQVVERDPEIWRLAINQGHEFHCHTYAHHPCSLLGPSAFYADLMKYKTIITQKLGTDAFNQIKAFRFPYGDSGKKSKRDVLKRIIHEEFGWKISWWDHDLSHHASQQIVINDTINENVFHSIKDQSVILMHFTKTDADTFERFVIAAAKHNIRFGTFKDSPKMLESA